MVGARGVFATALYFFVRYRRRSDADVTPHVAPRREEGGALRREPRVDRWVFSTDGVGFPVPVGQKTLVVPDSKRWVVSGAYRHPAMFGFGVGIEQRLGDRFTLYGGAARNASPWTTGSETFAAWDLTDVSAGLSFDRGSSRLSLGLGYSWGSREVPLLINPPGGEPSGQATEISYGRWTISLGVSLAGGRR